jgi:organic radical activating enzyme
LTLIKETNDDCCIPNQVTKQLASTANNGKQFGCGCGHNKNLVQKTQPPSPTISPQKRERVYHPRGLEIDVVYGCNMNCPQCSHASQYQQGYLPVKDFVEWCEAWAKRIHPFSFYVIGGEPLLHPQLPQIIEEAKRIWKDAGASKIGLYTNGTLPHRITPELINALKNVEITISVKPYENLVGKDYTDKIKESIRIYYDHKLNIRTRNYALKKWIDDLWLPHNNEPEAAFKQCWTRECVQPIYNGKLYRCLALEVFQKLHKIGKLDWHGIMDYAPLSPDCSDEEIKALIELKIPCEWCRYCALEHPIFCGVAKEFPQGEHAVKDIDPVMLLSGDSNKR